MTNELLLYTQTVMSYFIGARLREIRISNRFSISDVCERTGVSRAQISLIENGKADPRLSTVVKLLSSYGSDLSDLAPMPAQRTSLDEIAAHAEQAARRLEEVGLGPSDPNARLDLKASRTADVAAERLALATRR